MALHPTGLGKGLDALIRQTHEERELSGIQTLPITDIIPNPRQPRREFNEKTLDELAASIKSQGLLQPLLVRPLGQANPNKYEIVAGERRWRASQIAGLKELPVFIRSLSAQDTLAAALIENLQRDDLNPMEEALALQALKEEFGLSQDDMAHKLGKSRSAIANSLRLLSLPESMHSLLASGKLSSGHARALLSVTDLKAQEYLKNLVLENRLSVREAEGLAASWKEGGRFDLAGFEGGLPSKLAPQGENENRSAPSRAKPGSKKPQSAKMLDIQNQFSNLFKLPVRVTGQENKGKITLTFNTKEELQALLQRLSGNALEGTRNSALESADFTPLTNVHRVELLAHGNAALNGAHHPSLGASGLQALASGNTRKALDQNSDAKTGDAAKAGADS